MRVQKSKKQGWLMLAIILGTAAVIYSAQMLPLLAVSGLR